MASHGVPRVAQSRTAEEVERDRRRIEEYRSLEQSVRDKVSQGQYTAETLQLITDLLTRNPEYYTIWNYRRLVRQQDLAQTKPELSDEAATNKIAAIIKYELEFLVPLLRQHPKCYWIWNYRMWLLDQARALLPRSVLVPFWQTELALVGKMLNADRRNFHGWGYRRFVVRTLEDLMPEERSSLTQSELEYSTKMIRADFSNYSAWHNRTKLLQKYLDEKSASDEERKKVLDEELEFAHRALIDPYDQSIFFHHQDLMCTFDPALASQTLAPNLSDSERLQYIREEKTVLLETLDGAEDSKWLYQALIECELLAAKIQGTLTAEAKADVQRWLSELMKLDPLRRGRWLDLQESLDKM